MYTDPPGAVAYYLRRVLQNWGDDKAVEILSLISAAMHAHSRLLICELLLPSNVEPGTDVTPFYMDYTLMQLGGRVRTESDFSNILFEAGLMLHRVWTHREGGHWVVLEARLMEAMWK